MLPPLVEPAAHPLDLSDVECWVVPRTVGDMVGAGRARDAVMEGMFRPADIDRAELGEVESIAVPIFRFEGTVSSFSIGMTETVRTIRTGPDVGVLGGGGRTPPRSPKKRLSTRRHILPTGGFSHQSRVEHVLARRGFPVDPSAKIAIRPADLVKTPFDELDPAATVLPDIDEADAAETARLALQHRGHPKGNALFAKVDVELDPGRLCFYPLYVLRYRYGGEAVDGGDKTFFVAVSGTTGKVVASEHPPFFRSVASKIRSWF
ncbi:MAG: hypothetical protein AB7S26_30885 [Sandaracinaceae bacterium]